LRGGQEEKGQGAERLRLQQADETTQRTSASKRSLDAAQQWADEGLPFESVKDGRQRAQVGGLRRRGRKEALGAVSRPQDDPSSQDQHDQERDEAQTHQTAEQGQHAQSGKGGHRPAGAADAFASRDSASPGGEVNRPPSRGDLLP